MNAPAKTEKKQDGRFVPGVSGNPAGRPRGSRHKASLLVEQMFEEGVSDIAQKVLELARSGDLQACKLVIERILPPRREMPIQLELPPIRSSADATHAMSAVLEAVARGDITPSEGAAIAGLVKYCTDTLEMEKILARVSALEMAKK